jgi:hypothetical protein
MKAFGYQKDKNKLLELREVSILTTIKELETIIKFLQYTKDAHSKIIEKDEIVRDELIHSHFRDWNKNFEKGSSDFIVGTINAQNDDNDLII